MNKGQRIGATSTVVENVQRIERGDENVQRTKRGDENVQRPEKKNNGNCCK